MEPYCVPGTVLRAFMIMTMALGPVTLSEGPAVSALMQTDPLTSYPSARPFLILSARP